jgi:signal transduction histidine kinase
MRSSGGLITFGVVSTGAKWLSARASRGTLPRWPRSQVPGERYWLTAGVLVACVALIVLGLRAGPYPHSQGGGLIVTPLACVPLWALRRWGLALLMGMAAITALVAATGKSSLAIGIMLGLASYFAASRLPRRRSIQVAVAAAVIIGAGLLLGMIMHPGVLAAEPVDGLAPLAAGWFVGDSVAARRRYMAGLAEQAERERATEAERAGQQVRAERVRIAREMHDVVAHTLAVMTVQAGVGRRLMDKRPQEASAALESIETIGRTAQNELRVALGLLRDEEATAALAPAPKLTELKDLAETVRASGTPVELRMSGAGRELSPALELSIYRVVQEALTNVVKHAPGARATVDLAVSATGIHLEVVDDGGPAGRPALGGAQPDQAGQGTGHGIVGMRERIAAFGGWLVARPLLDRGFLVTADVPFEGHG